MGVLKQLEVNHMLGKIKERLSQCKLQLHPQKTKIVYCKKEGRNQKGLPVQFDFLGYSFRPIMLSLKKGGCFLQYDCKMSRKSKKRILGELRSMKLHVKSQN